MYMYEGTNSYVIHVIMSEIPWGVLGYFSDGEMWIHEEKSLDPKKSH